MFEKWFKENNENIYILREDLDILKSNKDLNILNLYLNLNKKNGEFGIEELLKDMIIIKENIIKIETLKLRLLMKIMKIKIVILKFQKMS